MSYQGHRDQKLGHETYSQHSEDLMILNLCKLLKLDQPSYLDLGAHHPTNISNTALLYQRGSRGMNVEANPLLIDAFHKERPEDKNICVAVDVKQHRVPFYLVDDHSGLNSLKSDSFAQHGVKHQKEIVVQTMTINGIVDIYNQGHFPDILLTDIEEMDIPILDSGDFSKSKPKIICSEIRPHEGPIAKEILKKKGFTFLCRMISNLIFVQEELFDQVI
jgi:hypothetical protein